MIQHLKTAYALALWDVSVNMDPNSSTQPCFVGDVPRNMRSPFKLNWKGLFNFLDDALTNVDYVSFAFI
jgi:hypothetical protein